MEVFEITTEEQEARVETPVSKTVKQVLRSPLGTVSAALLLCCAAALDFYDICGALIPALLFLNLVAVSVSAGVKSVSFRKGVALANFIVFAVSSLNGVLRAAFPNSNLVIYKSGNFKIALLPDWPFLSNSNVIGTIFTIFLAVYFLLKYIADRSLKKAVIKNLPLRRAHIFCGIALSVLCICAVLFAAAIIILPPALLNYIPNQTRGIHYIYYIIGGSFALLGIAMLLNVVECFKNFLELRKLENAF